MAPTLVTGKRATWRSQRTVSPKLDETRNRLVAAVCRSPMIHANGATSLYRQQQTETGALQLTLQTKSTSQGKSARRDTNVGRGAGRHASRAFSLILAAVLATSMSTIMAPSANAASGTTLHVVLWSDAPAIAATDAIDAAFEKANPGVNIVVSSANIQTSAYNTLVTSMLAAKEVDLLAEDATIPALAPPSYTHIPASGTLALQEAGQIINLAGQPFMKYFGLPFQTFANGIGNKIYGLDVSEYTEQGSLIVKTAILKKYGLSLPTTFSQFLQECADLKSHGITPLFVTAQGGQSFWFNGPLYQRLMAGHTPSQSAAVLANFDHEFYTGQLKWNSPLFQSVGQQWVELMKYAEPGATAIGQNNSYSDWAGVPNNYPFFGVGNYAIPIVLQANPKLQLTEFTFPGTNNPKDTVMVLKPDLSWMIPTSSSHVSLAEKWLAFFTEPQNYSKWVTATGGFSLETRVKNTASYLSWDNEHMSAGVFGPTVLDPWLPASAPLAAEGPTSYFSPTLPSSSPLGSTGIGTELNDAASAYASVLKSLSH